MKQDPGHETIPAQERLVDLALYLSVRDTNRYVTRQDIIAHVPGYDGYNLNDAKQFAAFRRLFESDKDNLRRLGLVIETGPDGSGYHIDAARTFMEPVEFSAGEVAQLRTVGQALLRVPGFPFARDLRIGLAKIVGQLGWDRLDDASRGAVQDAPKGEHRRAAAADDQAAKVRTLREALTSRTPVELTYHRPGQEPALRHFEPYGDFSYQNAWYVVGRDIDKDAIRVLRVSRIGDLAPPPRRSSPLYEIPSDFDVNDYCALPFQYGSENYQAHLYLSPDLALFAPTLTLGRGSQQLRDDGSLIWEVTVNSTPAVITWCVENGPGAVPLSPAPLREAYRQLLKREAKGEPHA